MHICRPLALSIILSFASACSNSPEAESAPEAQAGAEAPSTPRQDAAEQEKENACADESCFACGESLCLPGSICVVEAADEGSCIWLEACSAQPTCDCVMNVLGSSCSCEDGPLGPRVSCSPS